MVNAVHPRFKKGRTIGGVEEYVLDNGLIVLMWVDASAPVAGVMITYGVGSRNEKKGETGASHLLEHMMFKGSKNFNKKKGNDAWMLLERVGGKINATTWLDRTNYFEVVPKEHLKTAIQFEADRMRRAILVEKEFIPERAVVLNELVKYENEPTEVLDIAMWAESFKVHPYHHPTIGWKEDVAGMTVEHLKQYYETYYRPGNAVLSVFGDINQKDVLALVAREFGHYADTAHAAPEIPQEPAQQEKRSVTVAREGAFDIVAVAHKIPSVFHGDWPAMDILSQVLGGGKQSRLYKALVETNLATDVSVACFPFRDTALMTAYAFVSPGVPHMKVMTIMEQEFDRLAKKGVVAKELSSAKAKIAADDAFSKDGVYAFLQNVGMAVAVGDWTLFDTLPKKISRTTLAAVTKASRAYLTPVNRTIGTFVAKK